MCTICGSKQYGQDQPDAREKDRIKLEKVIAQRKSKNK